MQAQIYHILADRSGKSLKQIIRDTKRTDFYLDAASAKEYGLIDGVLGGAAIVDTPQSAIGRHPAHVAEVQTVNSDALAPSPGDSDTV